MSFEFTIQARAGQRLADLEVTSLRQKILKNRVLVLRGFPAMKRREFESYASAWGEILKWPFGSILDVVVDPNAKNYLFTSGSVPHHWDGAFAATVPFLQIFQCLQGPDGNAGGETVFCDTTRVWSAASPERQKRWEQISVRYRTEKVAHYGGTIESPLVSRHPITNEVTLRFAEPPDEDTAPLNPLSLEVQGDTLDHLMSELRPLLYAEDYCYSHRWRAGDYLIADNHALLHARRAFQAHAPRHLQRIHII